jgi:hypothetical protein
MTPTTALSRNNWIVQIHVSGPKRVDDGSRQRIDIDLEAYGQGRFRTHRRNRLVHSQHVGPELLVAKGVKAEDLLPNGLLRRGRAQCAGQHGRNKESRTDEVDPHEARHVVPSQRKTFLLRYASSALRI